MSDQSTRPPNQPPTPPPPPRPTPPAPTSADDAIFAEAERIRADLTPARQSPLSARDSVDPAGAPGGPVKPSVEKAGKGPAPGPAAAAPTAARESAGAAKPGAGASSGRDGRAADGGSRPVNGRAVGVDGAATFTTPPMPKPRPFLTGTAEFGRWP